MNEELESFRKYVNSAEQQSQTTPFLPERDEQISKNEYIINVSHDCKFTTNFFRGAVAQWLITFIIIMVYVGCGMPTGFSAILLPQLQAPNSTLPITEDEGSWIASTHTAATPLGGLLSGLIMERFGRKGSLCICYAPIILGWFIISIAKNITTIIIGRIIVGIAVGSVGAPSQIMISEISEPHLRGVLSTVPFVGHTLGILIMYIFGLYFEWRGAAILSLVISAVALLIFSLIPDTPIWLIRNGKLKKATKYLHWLRDSNTKAQNELQHLISRINMEKIDNDNNITSGAVVRKNSWYQVLIKPQVLKPFSIILVFALAQNLSGYYTIIFYAVNVIEEMGIYIDNEHTAILTAVIRLLFVILSLILISFIGRRPLALLSTITSGICALALGIILIIKSFFEFSSYDYYMIVTLLMIYVAGTTVGIMPLFGILIGELSPAKWRGLISGLSFGIFNFFLFIFTKSFPIIKNSIGISGMFILFGIYCLISALHFYLFLPETKNKSLSEIEDYFLENRYLWVRRNQ